MYSWSVHSLSKRLLSRNLVTKSAAQVAVILPPSCQSVGCCHYYANFLVLSLKNIFWSAVKKGMLDSWHPALTMPCCAKVIMFAAKRIQFSIFVKVGCTAMLAKFNCAVAGVGFEVQLVVAGVSKD